MTPEKKLGCTIYLWAHSSCPCWSYSIFGQLLGGFGIQMNCVGVILWFYELGWGLRGWNYKNIKVVSKLVAIFRFLTNFIIEIHSQNLEQPRYPSRRSTFLTLLVVFSHLEARKSIQIIRNLHFKMVQGGGTVGVHWGQYIGNTF